VLACAQLGRIVEARQWLQRAQSLDPKCELLPEAAAAISAPLTASAEIGERPAGIPIVVRAGAALVLLLLAATALAHFSYFLFSGVDVIPESREDGVYSTDDGGRHWRRIYPVYAVRVDRLSATQGVISVGAPAPTCGCSTQRLWTLNGGRSWRVARGIGGDFEGRGTLYWWAGGSLYLGGIEASQRLTTVDGEIVDAAAVPGGAVALVDRRSKPPQVIVAQGSDIRVVTLPAGPSTGVVRSIAAAGDTVVVTGQDDSSAGNGTGQPLTWRSRDGGRTWVLGS